MKNTSKILNRIFMPFAALLIYTSTLAQVPITSCNANAPKVYVFTSNGSQDIYKTDSVANAVYKGGDTIKIMAGNYTDIIEFDHLHGDPCKPIIIINSGGLVYTTAMRIKNDCSYVHITGTGTPGLMYGFKIIGAPLTMNYGNHLEFDHIEITNPANGVGMYMSLIPDPTNLVTIYKAGANNYTINKIHIHHNWVHGTLGEGMYVGNTAPDGDSDDGTYPDGTFHLPLRMDSLEIDHNIVDSTGWDGIQTSNARDNCLIHDNVVSHFGLTNMGSQQSGIIMGSNTGGNIYNNTISYGTGNGMEVFGYGTINIYGNKLQSTGYDGTTVGQESILIDDRLTSTQPTPKQQINLYDDTVLDPEPKAAIFDYAQNNNSLPSSVHDNIFCIPGAGANWQTTYLILDAAGTTSSNNVLSCSSSTPTPTANAGKDTIITLPTNTATLRGSGTETNGSIASYKWAQASGPSTATITAATSATTTVTGLTAGAYKFTLTVTDKGGLTATATVQVTVNAASAAPVISSAATATGSVNAMFSYTITASNTPTAYAASGLPSTLQINTASGVITGTPTAAGTYNVTVSATNATGTGSKSIVITINPLAPVISSAGSASGTVGTAFTYTIVASNTPASFSATGLPGGLTFNTLTGIISGTPTVAGTYSVIISATNAGGTATKTVTITISAATNKIIPAPVISSSSTASGVLGSAFSYTITASNTPTGYAATGLPTGLNINTSTGVISGTPTAAGTSSIIISATNAGGTGTKTLTITISAAAPVISSIATATVIVGTAFNYTIVASNTPTSFSATGLPAGLSVNTSTGVISGTPATAGTSSVTVSATNAGGTGTKTLTITVSAAAPVISSAATATGVAGTAFSYTIVASNTPTSYAATGLPAGLSLNTTTGVISGTSASAGTYTVTVNAANSAGTGSKQLVITIVATGVPPVANAGGHNILNWALTKDKSVIVSGPINANAMAAGTNFQPLGADNTDGYKCAIASGNWPTAATNGYNIDFPLLANANIDFTLTRFAFTAKTSGSSGNNIFSVAYQQDGTGSWTTFGTPQTITSGSTAGINFGILAQQFPKGHSYTIRLYVYCAAKTTSSRNVYIKNISLTGTSAMDITLPVNTITLAGSGTDADGSIASYQWIKIAGPSMGTITNAAAATTTVTGLVQGVYKFALTVKDNSGLTGKDTIQVTVNNAIASREVVAAPEIINEQNDMTVYPNPVHSTLTAKLTVPAVNQQAAITVVDISGRVLLRKEVFITEQNSEVQIDVSKFNNGIYFLNLNVKGSNIVRKIIKD